MRIAFLCYRSDPRVGGQGVFVRHVAGALVRRGHHVDILSGPPYPEPVRGARLVPIPSLDLYAQPHHGHRALRPRHLLSLADSYEYMAHLSGGFPEPYTFGRRVAHHLRRHRAAYDVVLDNQTLASGLLAVERAGLPVIAIVHHPIARDRELALAAEPSPKGQWLIRRWYGFVAMQERVARRLRGIVTVSRASADDVVARMGVARERITVAPPGVDHGVFRHRTDVERLPARIVTTASADVPLKGLRFLLEAYAALLADHPALELVVVGRLREDGVTAETLDRLGLRARVRFVHDLPDDELAALFASATLCVTPSLYEGFGLPAAEAMACGAPVVVSDGGALPEVVGDAGLVVPRGDAGALARAIAELLADPARRGAMAAASLARARLFSWDRFAGRVETVLYDTLAC
ncbi:glycosyltransferase family 4 protein [Sphingomonas sp.]|uniref:glycosyltransferase family 4 protein n=1 Tax=Sphingomonas sp. TaxID=28214 RepID=UPI003B00E2A9